MGQKRNQADMVDFYAFRDNERYKDDIFVAVNGESFCIRRGVRVMIPRYVAEVLEESRDQDTRAASFIEQGRGEYERASKIIG